MNPTPESSRDAETPPDAVAARRAQALERGLRVGAAVVAAMTAALWLDNSVAVVDGTALGWPLLSVALLATIGATTALALRPQRHDLDPDQLGREAAVLMLASSAVVVATGVGPAPSNALSHVPAIMLMAGFALLLPVRPLPWGLPTLGIVAAMWPIAQLATGSARAADFDFAVRVTELSLGLSLAGVFLVLHDVLFENRSKALARMARTADHDDLTGVLNRRALTERLGAEVARAQRHGDGVAVLMYDIDRFKRFNATLGYAAGDRMLVEVARLLDGMLELTRYVQASGCVGRYGGEEFVVVLPCASPELAHRFADESRAAVAALRVDDLGEDPVSVTVSVGVTWSRAPGDVDSLVGAADAAMYEAKSAGGDRVAQRPPDGTAPRRPAAAVFADRRGPRPQATGDARDDLRSVHTTILRWGLLVAALWLILFWPLDLATISATGAGPDPAVTLLLRCAAAAVAVATAVLAPRGLIGGAATARTQAISTLLVTVLIVAMSHETAPAIEVAYFSALIVTTLTWALAISAPPLLSMLTMCGVCAIWLGATVVDGAAEHVDVPYRVGLLVSAAVVALASQRVLADLRLDETRTRARLDELARIDALTGLPNRAAFMRSLRREIRRAGPSRPLGVVMVDLDWFKRLNDEHGHLAGDRALREVADAARATLRATDVFARLGGEEFGLLLPHSSLDATEHAAERLREAIAARTTIAEGWSLSASAGVTTWAAGEDADDTLARADAALRAAKRGGRDRVCIAPADGSDE